MSKKPSFIFSVQLNFCLNVFQNLKLASIKKNVIENTLLIIHRKVKQLLCHA